VDRAVTPGNRALTTPSTRASTAVALSSSQRSHGQRPPDVGATLAPVAALAADASLADALDGRPQAEPFPRLDSDWPVRKVKQSESLPSIVGWRPTNELLSGVAQFAHDGGRSKGSRPNSRAGGSSPASLRAGTAPALVKTSCLSGVTALSPTCGGPRLPPAQLDDFGEGGDCFPSSSSSSPALHMGSCSSPAGLQSVNRLDHKIAREFQAQPLLSPQQAKTQRNSRPTSPIAREPNGSPLDVGLSVPAKRENYRKERYGTEIALGDTMESIRKKRESTVLELDPNFRDSLISPELFDEDVKNLNMLIEEYAKSLKMEHMDNSEDNKRRRREEAERILREAALRKQRKMEQMARDPKRKVKLRLERKRQFEADTVGEGVPMACIDVHTIGKGVEKIPLVDVTMLRNNARGLNARDGVGEMLGKMKQEKANGKYAAYLAQQAAKRDAASSQHLDGDSFRPMSAHSCFSAGSTCSELGKEEKEARMRMKREAHFIDAILKKIGQMRAEHSYALPYSFMLAKDKNMVAGNFADMDANQMSLAPPSMTPAARSVAQSGAKSSQQLSTVLMQRSQQVASMDGTDMGLAESTKSPQRKKERVLGGAFSKMMADVCGKDAPKAPRRKKLAELLESTEEEEEERAKMQAQYKRIMLRWAKAKALAKVLMLFSRVKRKRQAAEIVKPFLEKLGEWARIKFAMKKMAGGVVILQKQCKVWLQAKRKRCDAMERMWNRLEERHLQVYFKHYTQKLLLEQAGEGGEGGKVADKKVLSAKNEEKAGKQAFFKEMQKAAMKGSLGIDWKQFCIPPRERKSVISRWYMTQLNKHIRVKGNVIDLVQQAVKTENEIARFLKSLGANDDEIKKSVAASAASTESAPVSYWHSFDEETILGLIALSAQAMRRIDPYQEHPANKDMPKETAQAETGSKTARRGTKSGAALSGGGSKQPPSCSPGMDISKTLDFGQLEKGVTMGAFNKGEDDDKKATQLQRKNNGGGVEDVFSQFTPRLKKIVEEQQTAFNGTDGSDEEDEKLFGGDPDELLEPYGS